MKYIKKLSLTQKFTAIVFSVAIRLFIISSIWLHSSSDTGTEINGEISMDKDQDDPYNYTCNEDLDYNYIENPNALAGYDIPADGLISYGDIVDQYLKDNGYKRTVLTITDVQKKSYMIYAVMTINPSDDVLQTSYDKTTNELSCFIKKK